MFTSPAFSQDEEDLPVKVMHAEPMYVDLIRDLGARKGEKEWNVGYGLMDKNDFEEYEFLIEYEFAPINRLGFEVELPFSFFSSNNNGQMRPENNLNGIQLATQYTFLVSKKARASLAVGYLHQFQLTSFKNYGKEKLFTGNQFNPFFIAAKRLGSNFHTLIYTGPSIVRKFGAGSSETSFEINANFHYMIPGTTNFIGLEFNQETEDGNFELIMRPQMRVKVTNSVLIGIVTGIPIEAENERYSAFFRLIYEPER